MIPEVFPDPNILCLCATLEQKCHPGGLAESAVTLEISTGTAPLGMCLGRATSPPVYATAPGDWHSSSCTDQILSWKNKLLRTANGHCSHVHASHLASNKPTALLYLLICIPKPQGRKGQKGGYGTKSHPKTTLKMRLELKERCTEESKS